VAAGAAVTTLIAGWIGDRVSRKSLYRGLFLLLAIGGTLFAISDDFVILSVVAISGVLVTDILEAGAFITVDQSSIASLVNPAAYSHQFGNYFGLSILAGSLGVLAAGAGNLIADAVPFASGPRAAFILFLPLGLMAAIVIHGANLSLPTQRRIPRTQTQSRRSPASSKVGIVTVLYGLDAFAGGFTTQAFVVYWISARFGTELEVVAPIFAALSFSQSLSFVAAGRIAARFGALKTMVVSHVLSSVGLFLVPFAPGVSGALGLLSLRYLLGNMDVPARQAFLLGVLGPNENITSAIAQTTAARYVTRPAGVALSGVAQSLWHGLPFVLTGGLKLLYDVTLISQFRGSWSSGLDQVAPRPPDDEMRDI
jgi:MFS family permease